VITHGFLRCLLPVNQVEEEEEEEDMEFDLFG
jgi:hypothetical protein